MNSELGSITKHTFSVDTDCPATMKSSSSDIELGENLDVFSGVIHKSRTTRHAKGKSLLSSLDNYVVLDLETTGLDPSCNDIIEIGAIRIENGIEIARFQSLINPGYEIDDFIIELTGITNGMLSTAPTITHVLPNFYSFVGDDIVVGHNVNIDINFLYDKCISTLAQPFSNDFIDTMRLSRCINKNFPNHKLHTLISKLSLGDTVEHRALSDAILTGKCYEHLKSRMADPSVDMTPSPRFNMVKAKDIKATSFTFNENNPFYGKVCVFTGTLDKMQRKDAMQIVVNLGGICGDSVTSKTNYLVLGNNDYCSSIKDGKSGKQKKAEQLKLTNADIDIISENVFYDMISEV